MFGDELQQQYREYTICGSAESVHNDSGLYFTHASVMINTPSNTCIQVDRYQDKLFVYDDEDLAQQVGLFLAELAVDHRRAHNSRRIFNSLASVRSRSAKAESNLKSLGAKALCRFESGSGHHFVDSWISRQQPALVR